jgi:hydrophobic/amphiphilic exporter-1 (mainly G- bacteria), HAE1 family
MSLPGLAVKRPIATLTILVIILVIGLFSLYQSPLDLLPDIQAPVLAVITVFPGSSPQETLELVTKPIEDSVSAVSGVTGLNSISQENLSLVILRFDWGINVKNIRENVSTRLDMLNLPDGVQRPMILEFDPTLMPIMVVAASGTEDLVELTEWLEETASPRLDSIIGVASVQVQGGAQQDLFIRTSPETMAGYEVSFEQIANVMRASLVDLPAGIVDLEDRQVRIRFLGRFAEIDMLSNLIVGFQVDQEALEELIGKEIDLNLNQMLAGQGGLFSGFSIGSGGVPVREIYWDDLFNFDDVSFSENDLYLPLNQQWAAQNEGDIKSRLFLFTANPNITYDANTRRMTLSLSSLGRARLPGVDSARLEDIWLLDQAVWDSGLLVVPLNSSALSDYAISDIELSALVESNPLVVRANPNHVLLTFHKDWDSIRRQPIVSIPDYGAWLKNIRSDVSRGIDDASRQLEDSLTELATAMILGSMAPGNSAFAGFDLGDELPINPISLEMIATIGLDTYSPSTIARFNQQPSISLVIQKEGDANTVMVARQIRNMLDQLAEENRGSFSAVQFNTVLDQAEEIERALADLAVSLAGGAILAILVLILFLRNWRTTMFIALSIPAAIIATFTLLYFANITINLMTLGGLALAAGMLVDNAIVVSENIFRRYQMGEMPSDAAVNGAREVAGAITASTLTTIAVFFPVIFLSGLAGQIFWEFALTVACAILASLLVALTVIPLLASRSLRRHHSKDDEKLRQPGFPFYRKLLNIAVIHPWWILIFVIFFVGAGVIGFTTLGTELFPSTDESAFTINADLLPGTALSVSDAYAAEIETILENKEDVISYSTTVGSGGFLGMQGRGGSSNQVRIRVEVDPGAVQKIDQIINEVREEVTALSGTADVTVSRESLLDAAGLETSLDLSVSGNELEIITEITEKAVLLLNQNAIFTDIQSSLEENRPEIHIRLDQNQALQKGVTQIQAAAAVSQALEGIPVSRIETDTGILNVILGYQKSEINTIEDLGRIGFYAPGGEFLKLEQVADLTEAFGPQSIPRENQKVIGRIQMQYGNLDLGTANEEAFKTLEEIALPDGYEIKPAGSFNLMGDVLSELQLVLIVAALLVYLVMAAQFESLLHPFVIICSLPLAYTGSVLALIITGNNISIPAMIGVVVLSGIFVNDGIIMVDFINQQRRIHGLPLQEAIIEGATARLRPILMTTATTVLGLVPLAMGLGEGSQLQAPMAITIIGGQITGTILLLLAIPSIYKVVTRDRADINITAAAPTLATEMVSGDSWFRNQASIDQSSSNRENGSRVNGNVNKLLIKSIMRMVVIFILIAIIFIIYSLSGQGSFTVIR